MGLGPQPGGSNSSLNITAATVIKLTGGQVYSVAPVTTGSAGTLTFNDVSAAPYSAATSYAIGNACTNGGTIYYCTAATTGNAPPNGSYWSTTAPAASKVLSIAYGSITTPFILQWPFLNGIVVSAVPTGAQLSVSYT